MNTNKLNPGSVASYDLRPGNGAGPYSGRYRRREEKVRRKLECGPMPNLMVALPNIGGALCSTPQSLVDAHY